jgi:hypothetical protein
VWERHTEFPQRALRGTTVPTGTNLAIFRTSRALATTTKKQIVVKVIKGQPITLQSTVLYSSSLKEIYRLY